MLQIEEKRRQVHEELLISRRAKLAHINFRSKLSSVALTSYNAEVLRVLYTLGNFSVYFKVRCVEKKKTFSKLRLRFMTSLIGFGEAGVNLSR